MAKHVVAIVFLSLSLTSVADGQEEELELFLGDLSIEVCKWISILARDVMTQRQGYEPMSETLPFALDRLADVSFDPDEFLGEFGVEVDDESRAEWSAMMEVFRQETRPAVTEMVMGAYDVPTYGIESLRRDAINEFENGTFEECYRGAVIESQRPLEPNEEAELRRLEEQVRLAREREEARQRALMEAELSSSMAVEAERRTAEEERLLDQYVLLIQDRIERAWSPPPSADSGLRCVVNLTQIPSGDVTGVQVGTCNGDRAVVRSIEEAVTRASPLPPPPTPSLFSRNLELIFEP